MHEIKRPTRFEIKPEKFFSILLNS